MRLRDLGGLPSAGSPESVSVGDRLTDIGWIDEKTRCRGGTGASEVVGGRRSYAAARLSARRCSCTAVPKYGVPSTTATGVRGRSPGRCWV